MYIWIHQNWCEHIVIFYLKIGNNYQICSYMGWNNLMGMIDSEIFEIVACLDIVGMTVDFHIWKLDISVNVYIRMCGCI